MKKPKQKEKPKIKRKIRKQMKQETAIIKRENGDLIPDATNLEKLAKFFLSSELFPAAKNVAGIISIIEYGRELGFPPIASLQMISVIKGRLCIESKALLAMAIKSGITYKVIKSDENVCSLEFSRAGFEPHRETFTSEDAARAKLTDKTTYVQYPKQMNFWRCVSNGVRAYAPDLALGLYSKEEMETIATIEVPVTQPEVLRSAESENEEKRRKEMEAEKEELVKDINYEVIKNNIHPQDFKRFLEIFQEEGTKQPRTFVGYKFGNLSFHEGDAKDLKVLLENLDYAIKEFKKWWEETKPKEEPKEDEEKQKL